MAKLRWQSLPIENNICRVSIPVNERKTWRHVSGGCSSANLTAVADSLTRFAFSSFSLVWFNHIFFHSFIAFVNTYRIYNVCVTCVSVYVFTRSNSNNVGVARIPRDSFVLIYGSNPMILLLSMSNAIGPGLGSQKPIISRRLHWPWFYSVQIGPWAASHKFAALSP